MAQPKVALITGTRKIIRGLPNISQGLEDCLYMGNIDALRDWERQGLRTHAMDAVAAGATRRLCDCCGCAIPRAPVHRIDRKRPGHAAALGGEDVNDVGYWTNRHSREDGNPVPPEPVIRIDLGYFRSTEVKTLFGDPTKAKQKLGWVPEIMAQEMCTEMVAGDLAEARQHAPLKKYGYLVNVSVD